MNQDNKPTDRILKATRHALNTASWRANQYKQVVQKKIDLGAIHKKIEQLHTELGKQVDDLFQARAVNIIENTETKRLLEKLASLKQAAALLEEEIELIRTELPTEPQPTESQATEKPETDQQD